MFSEFSDTLGLPVKEYVVMDEAFIKQFIELIETITKHYNEEDDLSAQYRGLPICGDEMSKYADERNYDDLWNEISRFLVKYDKSRIAYNAAAEECLTMLNTLRDNVGSNEAFRIIQMIMNRFDQYMLVNPIYVGDRSPIVMLHYIITTFEADEDLVDPYVGYVGSEVIDAAYKWVNRKMDVMIAMHGSKLNPDLARYVTDFM